MKLIFWVFFLGVGFSGNTFANTPDVALWINTYPSSNSFNNFNCAICHSNIAINTTLTNYGNSYKNLGRGLYSSLNQIEGMDSDTDGFSNMAEINAGSNPGALASTPNNVPPPLQQGGGHSGGQSNGTLSGSMTDAQNANMLASTGCGRVERIADHDDWGSGSSTCLSLLLFPLALCWLFRGIDAQRQRPAGRV